MVDLSACSSGGSLLISISDPLETRELRLEPPESVVNYLFSSSALRMSVLLRRLFFLLSSLLSSSRIILSRLSLSQEYSTMFLCVLMKSFNISSD